MDAINHSLMYFHLRRRCLFSVRSDYDFYFIFLPYSIRIDLLEKRFGNFWFFPLDLRHFYYINLKIEKLKILNLNNRCKTI